MARKQLETLTEQMYYLLLALRAARTARHGYAIMQDVRELTGGRVQIGAGTLYTLLSRFEEEGYIRLVQEGDSARKEYVLTEEGVALFEKERARLRRVLADTDEALRETGAQPRDGI